MALRLKPLSQQVIVITGASSGIGLATARMAARRGAKLVLAARNEQALAEEQRRIQDAGGECVVVVADVGNEEEVRRIADAAHQAFGGFDTWVNNAGVSVYGKIEEISIEDHRRMFETNFWGTVYGSRIALETLRSRPPEYGGALINIGSVVSELAIALQGMYSASKHAVAGLTEALRVELEKDGAPVSVTLVMPAAIDTPYPQHAKAYTDEEPTLPPPVYSPDVVAKAILYCAEHPKRDITVGGGGRIMDFVGNHLPWVMDKAQRGMMAQQVKPGQPVDPLRHDGLYRPGDGGRTRGHYEGHVMRSSAYTTAALHPVATALIIGGVTLGAVALLSTATGRGPRLGNVGDALQNRLRRRPRHLSYQETYVGGGEPPQYGVTQPDLNYVTGDPVQ